MQVVVQAIPFVLLAVIVGAIVWAPLRRRLPSRPVARPRRVKPPKLRVSQSRMDDELRDLIKRR